MSSWSSDRRASRSRSYSTAFSLLAMGAFLLVSGAIGWSVRYMRGWFAGARWEDGPIWWQVGAGILLVWLGARTLRRLLGEEWTVQPPGHAIVKYVGRGRSRRRLPDRAGR